MSETGQGGGHTMSSAREQPPLRLIRMTEVMGRTGLGRSALYERIQSGNFPQPVKLGRSSLWPEHEVAAWIADRIAERDGHALADRPRRP